MNIHAFIPAESLRPYVSAYLVIESGDELVNSVLPDTSLVLAFRYKGKLNCEVNHILKELPSSSLSGLRKSMRLFHYSKDAGNILVIFKEAGAAAFFNQPLHELFDESVALSNFTAHWQLSIIEEQLAEAADNDKRIRIVEQFLTSRLCNDKPDELIITAVQKIGLAKGMIRIKHLASSLYISQDAFEKRFRRVVGTSPKQFSSIIKLKSIAAAGKHRQSLTELALDAGYFDQAHFTKDFKSFTGQTPAHFFKSPSLLQINDFLQ